MSSVDGGSNGLSLDVVLVSFGGWLLPSGGLKYSPASKIHQHHIKEDMHPFLDSFLWCRGQAT